MTPQQIQNNIDLCKGEPVEKILRLFKLGMYRESQIKQFAEYFGCSADKHEVALHLSMGH